MAFKDEWIPQDDTMPADASIVNMIANEVIRIGEKGGGGSSSVDVVDNLASTDKNKALSANQGRILNDKKLDAGTETDYVSKIEFTIGDGLNGTYSTAQIYDKNGNQSFVEIHKADKTPTQNSIHLITSGAVYDAIEDVYLVLEDMDYQKQDAAQVEYILDVPEFGFDFRITNNVELRSNDDAVTAISFVLSDGIYSDSYISGLSFNSGSTPTRIDYTNSGILNWVGTDCSDNNGYSIFKPEPNKYYDIVFYFNGRQFIGLVNGFVPSLGNVVA